MLKSSGEDSGIFYQIDGKPGKRILKVEWKNAQLSQSDSTASDSPIVNFQIWLFEEDQHIEIHFGDTYYENLLLGYLDEGWFRGPDPKFICKQTFGVNIFGTPDNPSYSWEDYSFPTEGALMGLPQAGTIYIIQPNPNSRQFFEQEISEDIDLYPNPVQDELRIVGLRGGFAANLLEIANMQGQVVFSEDLTKSGKTLPFTIDLSAANPGVYFVKLRNNSGEILNRKIVVVPN